MLLCLASPLGQLIDFCSLTNLLSDLLACYFLCLAFQFAWLLACLSSPYLLSQPLDFKQRNLLQNRCDRSKACCCSHPFATDDVFFSPTLEVFHKRITSTGAWTPPWNSSERWDANSSFFVDIELGAQELGFCKAVGSPLESRHGKADHYRSTHHDAATRSPCGASTRSLPSVIGLAATRPINSSLQQVEKFGPSPRQLYQRTWAHGIDP